MIAHIAYSVRRTSGSPKGVQVKKRWEPMRLKFVGRVSELMQGVNGSNFDPGHDNHNKLGGG
jgi:hypothetical protein